MGTGFIPGVNYSRGVLLTPHPLLVPWSWKCRAIPLLPLWAVRPIQSLSACTRVTFTFTFNFDSPFAFRALFWIIETALSSVWLVATEATGGSYVSRTRILIMFDLHSKLGQGLLRAMARIRVISWFPWHDSKCRSYGQARVRFVCLTPAHSLREEQESGTCEETDCGGRGSISGQSILDMWQEALPLEQAAASCHQLSTVSYN